MVSQIHDDVDAGGLFKTNNHVKLHRMQVIIDVEEDYNIHTELGIVETRRT